ncbi:MAG: TIGR03643 family protein [Cyclobacteriaceae bacterium]|nr:TIGR03643 family protein [Cyclobacteriaceae bacterium]
MKSKQKKIHTEQEVNRIIEMAWEDRTPFEAIETQFGLLEKEVITLMRKQLKESSFRMWRRRTNGRTTKHQEISGLIKSRFKCTRQKSIASNKISKR